MEKSIEESVIEVKRVAKKNAGGTRISFSALVIAGNRNGMVGFSLGKAPSLSDAIQKASKKARDNLKKITLVNGTVPHELKAKIGASKILIKPAPKGAGLIAGGSVRKVLELAGVNNVSAKVLGTRNKASNVRSTIEMLQKMEAVSSSNTEESNKKESTD